MAKEKDNYAVLVLGAIVVILLLQQNGTHFQLPGAVGGQTPDHITDYATYTNVVTLMPLDICVGDNVTLTIDTNIPNGHCSLFLKSEADPWQFITSVELNANGDYSITMPNNFPTGDYTGAEICSDDAGNAKISNLVYFTVRFCASPPPPDNQAQPPNQVPCGSVYNPDPYLCPQNGYCGIPEQTCAFIPATLVSPASCGCRTLI